MLDLEKAPFNRYVVFLSSLSTEEQGKLVALHESSKHREAIASAKGFDRFQAAVRAAIKASPDAPPEPAPEPQPVTVPDH